MDKDLDFDLTEHHRDLNPILKTGDGTESIASSWVLGWHQPQWKTFLIYPFESRASELTPTKGTVGCTQLESSVSLLRKIDLETGRN